MRACRPWLLAELRTVDPDVVVALGATAGKALLPATVHPSAVLRAEDRDAAYAGLVEDLKVAAQALSGGR